MNMYWHELKATRKSTIIWTLSITLLIIFFMSMYPTFSKEAESLRKMLEGFPDALLKAMNFDMDTFTSILGFYSYIFLYILLCGAIQAMILGIGILSKEVREKTADFLLTKPVTRQQILTSKLLAALTSIVSTNIGYLITVLAMASIVEPNSFDQKLLLMISITLLFIQVVFLAIGISMSVLVPKIKSVLPISLGTVFGFFIVSMFASSIGDEKFRYITPFQYFDAPYILQNQAYDLTFVVLSIVLVSVLTAASYIIYVRKDIHAV
ncbi:ABC transporter permease subunit [Aquibacillus halophilus]|uniref:ABC transporter permease subunit n=1 Tax=Aquibacillus halophilus TaxID=930132 RepID=A0A6A8DL13_9BACI|nr:ABC transporter permease subunit [Aquibacillus halophilus]MRH43677.1 ABC transporter permease subunit [Aquibacillus halophilus]